MKIFFPMLEMGVTIVNNERLRLSDAPDVLTVAEVAAIIGCDPHTVREWLRAGVLRGVKSLAGSRWLIPRERLVEFLKGGGC